MEQIVSEFGEATVILEFRKSPLVDGAERAHPRHCHEAVKHATSCLRTDYGVLKIDGVIYTPTSVIAEMLNELVKETPSTHILGRKRYTAIDDALAQRIIDYNTLDAASWADNPRFNKNQGYRSVRSRARAEVIVAFVFAVTN